MIQEPMINRKMRLHFTAEEAYSGLAEVEGIMRLEPRALVLEFQVKDSIFGVIKSKAKDLRIPFEELEEVEYKVNWRMSRFEIYVQSMHLLGQFPGSKDGRITLKIKRKYKQNAKEFSSHLNLRLSEYRLSSMDDGEDSSFLY